MEQDQSLQEQSDKDVLQMVCFSFGQEQYAIDITNVQEVIRVQKVTHVPQMPDFTLGVINIRGDILPVFDLRKKFGMPEKQADDQTKMIVVDVGDARICFIVDAILDNVKLEKESIVPAPNMKMKIKHECIQGIGNLKGRMIVILDIIKLHESILEDIKAMGVQAEV